MPRLAQDKDCGLASCKSGAVADVPGARLNSGDPYGSWRRETDFAPSLAEPLLVTPGDQPITRLQAFACTANPSGRAFQQLMEQVTAKHWIA